MRVPDACSPHVDEPGRLVVLDEHVGQAVVAMDQGHPAPGRDPTLQPSQDLRGLPAQVLDPKVVLVDCPRCDAGLGFFEERLWGPVEADLSHLGRMPGLEAGCESLTTWRTVSRQRRLCAGSPGRPSVSKYSFLPSTSKWTRLARDQPGTLTAKATLANALHRFDQAYQLAQRALGMDPTSVEALAALADAQVELGLYEDAAETVQQLLDLDRASRGCHEPPTSGN